MFLFHMEKMHQILGFMNCLILDMYLGFESANLFLGYAKCQKNLPWYGRRNRQRKVEAEVQSGQQSRRLEHISVKVASHVWIKSFGLLSYIHSHEFFHWRKKISIIQKNFSKNIEMGNDKKKKCKWT